MNTGDRGFELRELDLATLELSAANPGTFSGEWGSADSDAAALTSLSPVDGKKIAAVALTTDAAYDSTIRAAQDTFIRWRETPAPRRGEIVREIGQALRSEKQRLGELIAYENGKILQEALGEVQEAIDIADFAVGLSRQLYGNAMHSERPSHRMFEQWHPLGPIGVITAFNFPLAVWAWNAMIGAVCGDVIVWKPSEHTPLTAVAATKICERVTGAADARGVFCLVTGNGPALGQKMAADPRLPLVSATGSCAMGRSVGAAVAARLGRSLLELGGNNAVIVAHDADIELAARAIFFGAVGTAGQRCTTTRRVFADARIHGALVDRLKDLYAQVRIGDPRKADTLMGPLISAAAVESFRHAVTEIVAQGGKIVAGGTVMEHMPSTHYVTPTLVLSPKNMPILQEEIFAPILHIISVASAEEAIALNNAVPQGLSSAIFTSTLRHSEQFISHAGSDCGIANVNLGTSGAEIGGAFGGEKDTGGGRESGSDSWKAYMRRQTNTVNWSGELPLAQGIRFGDMP